VHPPARKPLEFAFHPGARPKRARPGSPESDTLAQCLPIALLERAPQRMGKEKGGRSRPLSYKGNKQP